jgi:hypothetical protein
MPLSQFAVRLFGHGYLTRRRYPEFRRKRVPGSTELSANGAAALSLHTLTSAGDQRRNFSSPWLRTMPVTQNHIMT